MDKAFRDWFRNRVLSLLGHGYEPVTVRLLERGATTATSFIKTKGSFTLSAFEQPH